MSGLSKDETETLVRGIMEVDVGDGCRDGRLRFIRDHLGNEWAAWAEHDGKRTELYVLVVEYTNDEAYNALSDHDIAEWIVERAEDGTEGQAVVTHRRWDLHNDVDTTDLMNTVSRNIMGFRS